jgi:cytochrome P450
MRDEAPLYYNEKFNFFALTRYDDVSRGLADWERYRSGRGTLLELIRADFNIPPGNILWEDPPEHDIHRGLLSRVFTPSKMNAIEPQVREFTRRCLDPLVGSEGFDFIADLGAQMPMRTIGYLLGIPEQDQEAIRDRLDRNMRLAEGQEGQKFDSFMFLNEAFAEYIDWRAKNPSNDLMTELLNAEYEDKDGKKQRLTRTEILTYVTLLSGAGNETTTRLIGWTGKLLGERPDQRREIVNDRSLIPNAIEEILRLEAPSPVQARYVTQDVEYYGQTVPEGSVMLLLNGAANHDDRHFPDAEKMNVRRKIDRHLSFGYGLHFCLGSALARLEGRVALDEIIKRWPDWEVDLDKAEQAHTSTVRGWDRLPVFTR